VPPTRSLRGELLLERREVKFRAQYHVEPEVMWKVQLPSEVKIKDRCGRLSEGKSTVRHGA
jgi:hypothetical protein